MSIAIKRLERAISDLPRGGMQTGRHKVKLDLADAERLITELNALQAERDALLVYAFDAEKWFNNHDPQGYVSPKRAEAQSVLAAHDAEVAKAAFIAGYELLEKSGPQPHFRMHNVIGHAENYAASLSK